MRASLVSLHGSPSESSNTWVQEHPPVASESCTVLQLVRPRVGLPTAG
jgi:hypothetical protein